MKRDQVIFSTPPARVGAASDLNTLLNYQDGEFIQAAYETILDRDVDPDGFAHYLQRLRSGAPKLEILRDLYVSDEARLRGVQLPWLSAAIRRDRWARRPLIGVFHRILANQERRKAMESRLIMLERKLEQLELNIRNGRYLNGSRDSSDSLAFAELPGMDDKPQAGRPFAVVSAESEPDLSGMSLVAKRVFRELSESVANRTFRQSAG
jgi:O-antigen chain-terminating methyltransferase